jgi:hypothetical protein
MTETVATSPRILSFRLPNRQRQRPEGRQLLVSSLEIVEGITPRMV